VLVLVVVVLVVVQGFGPLWLGALDQAHVLCHDPHVVVVEVPAGVAVRVVLVARGEVVSHLARVSMGFNLASMIEDMNTSHHVCCTVVAISAQAQILQLLL